MKRVKQGATLLITTLLLAVVTVTSAAFTAIYFRYQKMNHDFSSLDLEKVSLRSNSNVTFEYFLSDSEVQSGNETKKLQSELLADLEVEGVISAALSTFTASFKKVESTTYTFAISSDNYTINSKIYSESNIWNLEFLSYERRAK